MMSPVHLAQFPSLKMRHCDSAELMCTYLCSGVVVFFAFFTTWERCAMMSPVHLAQFLSVMARHCDSAVLMCTYLCTHCLRLFFWFLKNFSHFLGKMGNDVTCTLCTVSFLEGETL